MDLRQNSIPTAQSILISTLSQNSNLLYISTYSMSLSYANTVVAS